MKCNKARTDLKYRLRLLNCFENEAQCLKEMKRSDCLPGLRITGCVHSVSVYCISFFSFSESGRLNEDDSIVSSMNDLDPVQLPSGNTHSKEKIRLEKDASNTGTSLQSENAKDISILGDKTVLNRKENKIQHHLTESEENSFKISKKGESEKYAESVSDHSNGGTVTNVAGFDRHSDILGANGTFEVKELTEGDEGKLSQMSSTLYEKSLSNGSLSDTSANVREMNDVSKLNADTRRHSTELDMAEIKERRQRDTKDCPDETNIYGKENNTLKLSDNVESER